LVTRWQRSDAGWAWLEEVLAPLRLAETVEDAVAFISAADWPSRRRVVVEGVLREAEVEALPDDASQEDLALAMAKSVARRAVLDWEGVGDAMGQPMPISPEGIDALLEIWPIFEAFQTQYVSKGLILDAEKNVSAPSPTGPSAGATATARRATGPAPTAPQD
jgi:hypothetical protein